LLHVDTGWKFREMIAFATGSRQEHGLDLIVHVNKDGVRRGIDPFASGSALYTQVMKTEALKQALDAHGFDAAFGGARRDEEKSRAKERVFSFRAAGHGWDPRNQRPELWGLYNTRSDRGVVPRLPALQLDRTRRVGLRSGRGRAGGAALPRPAAAGWSPRRNLDHGGRRAPAARAREAPETRSVRFRTLGCYPLSGATESRAETLESVVAEMRDARTSERQGRLIDSDEEAAMERKKREGYF
jgi:sulfate adenylyltransferase subunit 2